MPSTRLTVNNSSMSMISGFFFIVACLRYSTFAS